MLKLPPHPHQPKNPLHKRLMFGVIVAPVMPAYSTNPPWLKGMSQCKNLHFFATAKAIDSAQAFSDMIRTPPSFPPFAMHAFTLAMERALVYMPAEGISAARPSGVLVKWGLQGFIHSTAG